MQPPPPPGLSRERRQGGPSDSGRQDGSAPSTTPGSADASSKGKRPYWRNKNKSGMDDEQPIQGSQPPPPPPPSHAQRQQQQSMAPYGTPPPPPSSGRHGRGGRGRTSGSSGAFTSAGGHYVGGPSPPSGFFPGSPVPPAFTPPPPPPPGLPSTGRRGRGGSTPQTAPPRHLQQQQQRSSSGGPGHAYGTPPSQNSSQNGSAASTASKGRKGGQPRYPEHVSGALLQVGMVPGRHAVYALSHAGRQRRRCLPAVHGHVARRGALSMLAAPVCAPAHVQRPVPAPAHAFRKLAALPCPRPAHAPQQGLKSGAYFRGVLRVNASDRTQAFCSLPGLPTDVFIRVRPSMPCPLLHQGAPLPALPCTSVGAPACPALPGAASARCEQPLAARL